MTSTNQERAERCEHLIAAYTDYDIATNVIDLLADAMHWCHLRGTSFTDALKMARKHVHAEASERNCALTHRAQERGDERSTTKSSESATTRPAIAVIFGAARVGRGSAYESSAVRPRRGLGLN